jgi:hypothetical protein
MKDLRKFIKTRIREFLNENNKLSNNDLDDYLTQIWFDLDHWFTPAVCINLETIYGLNLSDYESDEYRLKARTDNYDFGIMNKTEHNKCVWWKGIIKKSQKEPIKYEFLKNMVYQEMKSYFYDFIYKDDLDFKNNFEIIFNKFLSQMINNILKSEEYGSEKYDENSLKIGLKKVYL